MLQLLHVKRARYKLMLCLSAVRKYDIYKGGKFGERRNQE